MIKGRKYFFRKFTRKKFAVFNSMHRVVHISTLVVLYCMLHASGKLTAQDDTATHVKTINLEEVEIVGQKGPANLEELPRLVTVILSSEIECAPVHSINDLLGYTANVDLRQRGKDGIQSDISIRGGSFDHNLILLNGVNISDPQTGHLSLFLPIESESVKQIEILNGPAARVHGANAFAGAVNFVTWPENENSFSLKTSVGEYGFLSNSATINLSSTKIRNTLNYNNGFSSGYTKNTDYKKNSIFYQGIAVAAGNTFNIQFGYSDRAFGANSYYSPRYPDQYEENQLTFASFGLKTGEDFKIHPQIYWRRLRDRFELFRDGENWYRIEDSMAISNNILNTQYDTITWYHQHNHHINDVYGAQFNINKETSHGVTTVGWHLRSENIISTNIGYNRGIVVPVRGYEGTFYNKTDNRTNMDVHLEQTMDWKSFYIAAGLLLNWNSYLPDEVNLFPGIDVRYFISKALSLYTSYNYTLGIPTFTDLTYEDPTNQGNNNLKPYSQHSSEGGLRFMDRSTNATIACFYNYGEGVIDWIWFSDESKFKPVNVGYYSGKGIEFSGHRNFYENTFLRKIIRSARVSYTFIDMDKEIPGNITKYFNIRQKASAMIRHEPFKNFVVAENFSFTQREGSYMTYNFDEPGYILNPFKAYWLLDVRISYTWRNFIIYAEATNLLDKKYIDIGSIYQPGRWISAGLKYEITGL
jgi:vitamin B12 transporter